MSRSEASGLLRPSFDVGPVPRRSTADDPAVLGEDASLSPLVDGLTGNSQALSDLHCSYGFDHGNKCKDSLDIRQPCLYNIDMTNTAEQNYTADRDNESGGDYPYYLDMGGELSRDEWEAAGYPITPDEHYEPWMAEAELAAEFQMSWVCGGGRAIDGTTAYRHIGGVR